LRISSLLPDLVIINHSLPVFALQYLVARRGAGPAENIVIHIPLSDLIA